MYLIHSITLASPPFTLTKADGSITSGTDKTLACGYTVIIMSDD